MPLQYVEVMEQRGFNIQHLEKTGQPVEHVGAPSTASRTVNMLKKVEDLRFERECARYGGRSGQLGVQLRHGGKYRFDVHGPCMTVAGSRWWSRRDIGCCQPLTTSNSTTHAERPPHRPGVCPEPRPAISDSREQRQRKMRKRGSRKFANYDQVLAEPVIMPSHT